jgi:hypothetical protein
MKYIQIILLQAINLMSTKSYILVSRIVKTIIVENNSTMRESVVQQQLCGRIAKQLSNETANNKRL